jgi:hypothetical protein
MKSYSVCGSRIGHGVSSVAVCDIFVDERTLALSAPLLAVLDCGLDG